MRLAFFCILIAIGAWGLALGESAAPADRDLRVLQGDQQETLFHYLLGECDRLDAVRRQKLEKALAERGTFETHQGALLASYRELMGRGAERTPLNPVVTGALEVDQGYRIEKLYFESQPGHRVTCLLYLPTKGKGPWPGVLFACGHSANGKAQPAYQKACAFLALNGFVVLCYDPISQGERTQLPKAPRFGTTTHTLLNVGSRLVGRSVVWYEAWDGIRAIDYLLSRPEVDRSKSVGMTGTSGGGTQTTFLMALDERIGPAAPSCYIMERTVKFRSAQGIADGCQHLPGEGKHGIDHIDYVLMRAPKPTAILAATRDFFDIESTKRASAMAQRTYALFKAEPKHHLFVAENEHGMHVEHRQEAVRWMRQWLYGDEAPVLEPEVLRVFSDEEVQVTSTGQLATAFPDAVSVADLNRAHALFLNRSRRAFAEYRLPQRQDVVATLLGVENRAKRLGVVVERRGAVDHPRHTIEKLILRRGDHGFPVPALLFVPQAPTGKRILFASSGGMAEAFERLEKRADAGEAVLAIDLRGFGETRDRGSLTKYYNHEHRTANIAMHLGRPLLGQRLGDLQLGLDHLVALDGIGIGRGVVGVLAAGDVGPVAMHLVFMDSRIAPEQLTVEASVRSWIDDVLTNPLKRDQVGLVVPGALEYYDLPDLLR